MERSFGQCRKHGGSGGRRGAPPGPDEVEEWNEQGEESERPESTVGPEEPELDVRGAGCDERPEHDASRAGVRRGLRVRNHEEREEEQRAALEPMERDRQR